MNNHTDKERLRICGGDRELYELTIILDKYNLGNLAIRQKAEYISEARSLKRDKVSLTSIDNVTSYLIQLMREQFDWQFRPILKKKFKLAAAEIFEIWKKLAQ